MPLYRFKCKSCSEEFVVLCGIGKEEKVTCKNCGSSRIEKLLPRHFVGKTAEGKLAGSACSTCTASSCKSCQG